LVCHFLLRFCSHFPPTWILLAHFFILPLSYILINIHTKNFPSDQQDENLKKFEAFCKKVAVLAESARGTTKHRLRAYTTVGQILMFRGGFSEALPYFHRALEQVPLMAYPDNARPYPLLQYITALMALGRVTEAESLLQEEVKTQKDRLARILRRHREQGYQPRKPSSFSVGKYDDKGPEHCTRKRNCLIPDRTGLSSHT
jgi:tetratricopeptide (TPR) repeat protein